MRHDTAPKRGAQGVWHERGTLYLFSPNRTFFGPSVLFFCQTVPFFGPAVLFFGKNTSDWRGSSTIATRNNPTIVWLQRSTGHLVRRNRKPGPGRISYSYIWERMRSPLPGNFIITSLECIIFLVKLSLPAFVVARFLVKVSCTCTNSILTIVLHWGHGAFIGLRFPYISRSSYQVCSLYLKIKLPSIFLIPVSQDQVARYILGKYSSSTQLLEPHSRFGYELLEIRVNLSPKRQCGSKMAKWGASGSLL